MRRHCPRPGPARVAKHDSKPSQHAASRAMAARRLRGGISQSAHTSPRWGLSGEGPDGQLSPSDRPALPQPRPARRAPESCGLHKLSVTGAAAGQALTAARRRQRPRQRPSAASCLRPACAPCGFPLRSDAATRRRRGLSLSGTKASLLLRHLPPRIQH